MPPTTAFLLFMTLVGIAAGVCFDNTTASPQREVVRQAHLVHNFVACQMACYYTADCLAFTFEPISNMCVFLGAVKERKCSGKGFYPHVKCAAKVNCDDTASIATSNAAFPRCLVKNDFFNAHIKLTPKVCNVPPSEIICEQNQCFCKNPNQQLVTKHGPSHSYSVKTVCAANGNEYSLTSPNGVILVPLKMSPSVCTTIARTSYDKCMCDLPLVIHGVRNGDRLCGDKKMTGWGDVRMQLFTTNLACTRDGWSDGVKIVKPEYVFCE